MNRVTRARVARRIAGRQTAVVHRVAALLLEYPSTELVGMLPMLREAVGTLAAPYRESLTGVIDHLERTGLAELEAQYVETFDMRRRCSLYLTYYAYGDTRKRGVAMVEFKQAYRAAGFELVSDGVVSDDAVSDGVVSDDAELPDHLSVVLEFASTGDDAARESGLRLLLAHRAGLELLRLALRDAGSPYAGALTAVCDTLPPLDGDEREAVARLAAEGPPDEEVGLEPFAPPSHVPEPPRPSVPTGGRSTLPLMSVEGARR